MELEDNTKSTIQIDDKNSGISIGIRNLDFKYPDENEYVFKNLNLDIRSGEMVCITGSNGSGVSTLTKLLMSFFHSLRLPYEDHLFSNKSHHFHQLLY